MSEYGQQWEILKAVLPASNMRCMQYFGRLSTDGILDSVHLIHNACATSTNGKIGRRDAEEINISMVVVNGAGTETITERLLTSPEGQSELKQQRAQKRRRVFAALKVGLGTSTGSSVVYILINGPSRVQRSKMGCNGFDRKSTKKCCNAENIMFFLSFDPQGKFWRHFSKTAAPLHHFILRIFIINSLCGVQRRVQQGATGCNGGAMESVFEALHPKLKSILLRFLPHLVQWCNGKNAPNKFSGYTREDVMLCIMLYLLIILRCYSNYAFVLIIIIQYLLKDSWRVLRSIKAKTDVPLHPIPDRAWVKKNVFYYVNLIRLGLWGSSSYVRSSCYPVLCLCQPVLVTWLTTQLKCRNQDQDVTAHNYKLCDKGYFDVPVIAGLDGLVLKNCAIRFKLIQFSRPDQRGEYPPPHGKLTDPAPTPPLLLFIICSLLENPFYFLYRYNYCQSITVIARFFQLPVSLITWKRGSGGNFRHSFCFSQGVWGVYGC